MGSESYRQRPSTAVGSAPVANSYDPSRIQAVQIYSQPNPELPGYNPNEEHGLMQGGQVYALRDDLNITAANGLTYNGVNRPYSSHPYVLLEYADSDGRPSMSVFRVLREQGASVLAPEAYQASVR